LPCTGPGDAAIDLSCPARQNPSLRAFPDQLTFGSCGESQAGSGAHYFARGRAEFDHDASFEDTGGIFHKTYAHLHLSPPAPEFNLTALFSVTDMVRELLRPPPAARLGTPEEAMFTHNDCGHRRGAFVREVVEARQAGVAGYSKCFANHDGKAYEPKQFYFGDCEGTRDSVKTLLSSLHKFTFSLENTLSRDYITEKRYQALLGRSVPIVWNNHNSLDYLPDPDAAVVVDPVATDPVELAKRLRADAADEARYAKYFEWKKRGLRADYVRRLFLSSDFQPCRICEFVAHTRPPPPHRREKAP
jgi:Glycosyltransferase family 10 (fucosyltransferase) C-term